MAGLAMICKMYGSMRVTQNGKSVLWVWDYALDKSRLSTEMTKDEKRASARAKAKMLAQTSA